MSIYKAPSDPDLAPFAARIDRILAPEPKPTKPKTPSRSVPAPAAYVIPQLHLVPPDALVLCMVETECMTCAATFSYPSAHLMVRRGKHIHATAQSRESLANLPREITRVKANCRMCPGCFAAGPNQPSQGEPTCESPSNLSSVPQASAFLSLSTRTSENSSKIP